MSEGEVHPAVVIEIENGDASRRCRASRHAQAARGHEISFAGILERWSVVCATRHDKIDRAVVVIVRPYRAEHEMLCCQTLSSVTIGKCPVAIVPPHRI